jgi:hypothetical protein
MALTALMAFIRIQQKPALTESEHRWSTIWEMSLVTMGAAFMLTAHYYYFIFLTMPMAALAYLLCSRRQPLKFAALAAAYGFLAVFLIPLSLGSTLLHIDLWRFYMDHTVYLCGEVILAGLVLWEYTAMSLRECAQ